ncbi:MAG: succinylglutamate-semialdehyde dehydrogenase [Gammaproteobacteria bacterium]
MSLYIQGQWQTGSGAWFSRRNPANDAELWRGRAADEADVDAAFRAARQAFSSWSTLDLASREDHLRRYAARLEGAQAELAEAIAREVGKPRWEAAIEVTAMIAKVELSIRAYHARSGQSETQAGNVRHRLRHRPHGVVAVLGPYNFPGHLPNGHIVPALLAGNTVVFKPSELTPLCAEHMVRIWEAAGLPPGVLNLVQGSGETGAAVARHPQLNGLYFTGSARTGLMLHRQFAGRPEVILALEMGGNNPLLVGRRVPVAAAVHDIVLSAYLTSGQRCTCARRLFLPVGETGDAVLARLLETVGRLVVGAWDSEPEPFMGPVIACPAAESLLAAQERLLALGARSLLSMRPLPQSGAMLTPGLLDVSAIRELPDEEYFGPLLQVIRYSDFDAALDAASATRYGLAAGLLSEDEDEYRRFEQRIRAGIVNWNRPTTGASGSLPFGGIGHSGNHRPSAYYAADYCAYPVAGSESPQPELPLQLPPGLLL